MRRRIIATACAEGRYKIRLAAVAVVFLTIPYALLQRSFLRPPILLQPGPVDRAIPFVEASTWVYVSLYPLMVLPALLVADRLALRRYFATLLACAATAYLFFLLVPTTCPRPPVDDPGWLYGFLRDLDEPHNAFPSLHVAYAVAVLATLWPARPETSSVPHRAKPFVALWAAAVAASTLTTKQHLFIDLSAGAALGAAVSCVVGRVLQPARTATA